MSRFIAGYETIDGTISNIANDLKVRCCKHGYGSFSSNHEALGVIQEEIYELTKAIHENDVNAIYEELNDTMIACLWGMISMETKGYQRRVIE